MRVAIADTAERVVVQANQIARRWWPLIASACAGMVIFTMAYVVATVAEDRAQLREQRDAFDTQAAQLAQIIEHNDRFDATREARLNRAVADVEALLVNHFAQHDENVGHKLNETLDAIAALLDRPSGTPTSPISTIGPPAPHRRVTPDRPAVRPAPQPSPRPTTTTTTTTPDQKSCAKRPTGPRC